MPQLIFHRNVEHYLGIMIATMTINVAFNCSVVRMRNSKTTTYFSASYRSAVKNVMLGFS